MNVAAVTHKQSVSWRNAIFALFIINGLAISTWLARIPSVRDALDLTPEAVGTLVFSLAFGAIIGLTTAPFILHSLGPSRGMVAAFSLVVFGLIGTGITTNTAHSPAIAMVFLFILGFGSGSSDVMMNVDGAAYEQKAAKTLLPLMHAFFSLGTVIGAATTVWFSAINLDILWHFSLVGVVILVSTVISAHFLPRLPTKNKNSFVVKKSPTKNLKNALAVWKDPRLLLIGLIVLSMAFAEGSADDWLGLAVVDGHNQENTVGAVVFGIFVATMTTGRIVGGPILDRFGRVIVLRCGAILGAIGVALFINAPVLWVAIIGAVLWAFGSSLGFPVGISAAGDDPISASKRVSAVSIIGYTAFLAGPPLLGFLVQNFGVLNSLYTVLVLLICAIIAAPAARESTGRFAR